MILQQYLQRLLDVAYIDVYLSANDGARIDWPWRMQPVTEANYRYVDACDRYAVDSEPQSPAVDNQDVLDCAVQDDIGAGVVLLVDYFPFDVYREVPGPLYHKDGSVKDEADLAAFEELTDHYDSAYQASIDSVQRGLDLLADHPFDGDVWVPLQAPYVDSYRELGCPDRVAIGGLKDEPAAEKVAAARELRDAAGDDTWIHGLGFGVTDELAAALQDDPGLLDSIDYSSPVQDAKNVAVQSGDEVMSVIAARAGAQLIEDLRSVTPHPDPLDVDALQQLGFGDFTEVRADD